MVGGHDNGLPLPSAPTKNRATCKPRQKRASSSLRA